MLPVDCLLYLTDPFASCFFKGYLAEAEARMKGHSTSDDSITHSMSEVSVGSHHQGSAPGTPTVTHTNRDHQGNQDRWVTDIKVKKSFD